MKKKLIIIPAVAIAVLAGGFFYFRHQVYYSHGSFKGGKVIKIGKGEGNKMIAAKLAKEGLISGKIYFYYYLWSRKLTSKILPDEYELSGNLTIPEISLIITEEQDKTIKITFPEGWDSKQIELRIKNYELRIDEFQNLIKKPGYFKEKYGYDFLNDMPENGTLEGYLFPDTYFFSKDDSNEKMIVKMLSNFNGKLTPQIRVEIKNQDKSIHEIVAMASIIEGEVRADNDRKIVSGIFWKRLESGQPLQSCATLAYVLGVRKKQYSGEDTQVKSPYNTYVSKGLPPGPISNPGISSILAAVYPAKTEYNYFLSDPETGDTVFAKTYEEHVANKARYGL